MQLIHKVQQLKSTENNIIDKTLMRDEYLTSHLQYIADNIASGLTALAIEFHLLDCQQRKHVALMLRLLSKRSLVRAA